MPLSGILLGRLKYNMGYYNQHRSHFPNVLDPDAEAWITAAGVSDATQKTAIRNLVAALKSGGFWNLIYFWYPETGGTQTSNSKNLRNPSAYSVSFSGGTHNSAGYDGGGSYYGDTGFNPVTAGASVNSFTYLFYTPESEPAKVAYSSEMGAVDYNSTPNNYNYLSSNYYTGNGVPNASLMIGTDSGYTAVINYALTDTTNNGCFIGSRRANNDLVLYRNGSLLASNTVAISTTSFPNTTWYLGWVHPLGASPEKSTKTGSTYACLQGLTDTQIQNLTTIVNNYQTTLGRNTY